MYFVEKPNSDLFSLLTGGFLLLDGAMGTQLQQKGLEPGGRPELFSLTCPRLVEQIHREYLAAGSRVVYANTFGASQGKLAGSGHTVEEVVRASVRLARQAAGAAGGWAALDVGPLGEMLEPSGSLRFEDAYRMFRRQIKAGLEAGAQLIALETMTDLYEMKAALLAAREEQEAQGLRVPVLATMTFESSGCTFTGCPVGAMALTLEGLGADAVGFNCSLGPRELLPLARELRSWTNLPLVLKPNAGLPDPVTGAYHISPAEFAAQLEPFLELGGTVLGGCCGTGPEYIAALARLLRDRSPVRREGFVRRAAVCSSSQVVELNQVRVIGERINPTGKKRFQQALRQGEMDYILTQGVSQLEAGAHILDVNVGLPEIDEPTLLPQVVKQLQSILTAPLQIDSSDPKAIEAALRVYNGKAIVNSVNGEQASLERVLPVVKRYGAAVVGLTLDERGIPSRAEERLAVARRILEAALAHGIPREDVYIDCLTLTASAQQREVQETLRAVRMVKEQLGLRTVLGVSNISFGLPNRELINHSFLLLALQAGLDLPILNPNVASMMDAISAYEVLSNRDPNAAAYIARCAAQATAAPAAPPAGVPGPAPAPAWNPGGEMERAIGAGLAQQVRTLTRELLQTEDPNRIIQEQLIPALDRVGARFERGEIFLPQMIQSAQAAQAAFQVIKDHLAASPNQVPAAPFRQRGIVLATVKGDIHDIGKNIVKVILENYGYPILDLGRDVPAAQVVEEVRRTGAKLVGLSALMTTTLKSMEQTIRALRDAGLPCKVMVGGAVLTPEYAALIGADFYARDAKQSVDIAREVLG